jgi:hypothetical protein
MFPLPGSPRSLGKALQALLFLLATGLIAVAQDSLPLPNPAETPVPKSIVKGRVVYEDSSRPVRRSPIILFQLMDGPELSSSTDRDGRFVIKNVPAGVYFAMVNSPGIISPLPFMQITDKGPAKSMDRKAIKEYCTEIAVDGTSELEVTIHARHGGAVSGKVTYADGEPAINTEVSVLRHLGKQVTRVLTGINAAAMLSLHTDDRGMFRIAALPPGEYIISAAENNTDPSSTSSRRGGFDEFLRSDALTAAYYGGGTRLQDALPLKVAAGDEIRDVDIILPDLALHTISGLVVAHLDGLPLPGATLNVRNKEQVDWFQQGSQKIQSDSHGQWSFAGVPDGTYVITVEPPYNFAAPEPITGDNESGTPRPTRKLVPKETEITVAGSDVAAGSIELAEGASISGTVNLPDDQNRPYLLISCVYEGEPASDSRNTTGAYNGEFGIDSLRPGKIYVTASFQQRGLAGSEIQFYVRSITLNGKDLTKTPLTIAEGQSIKNVQIVIGSDPASAKVQLLDIKGKPMSGWPILVVPVESGDWLSPGANMMGTTDVNGIVPISGAPGNYFVLVAGPEDPWPPTKELVNSHAPNAPRIKLEPGANKIIPVILNP